MRIVLDTGVFFFPAALDALRDDPRPKIVPAVVFCERARQLHRDRGLAPAAFAERLADEGWVVEPLGAAEAGRIAGRVKDDRAWNAHARDALIAGHVGEWDELWTSNPRDFVAVGLDPRHVVDLNDAPLERALTVADAGA